MTKKLNNKLPIPESQIEKLFDYVGEQLRAEGKCDNTHRHTVAFLRDNNIEKDQVMKWLESTGGLCCDCEVMLNSATNLFDRRMAKGRAPNPTDAAKATPSAPHSARKLRSKGWIRGQRMILSSTC